MIRVIFVNQMGGKARANDPVYAVGTDAFMSFGLAQFIIREFKAREYPLSSETWRSDYRIVKITNQIVDGVVCRVFPSMSFPKPLFEFSFSMLWALIKESRNRDTIIHFMGTHSLKYHIYALFLRKSKVFATHLGDPDPLWRYDNDGGLRHFLFYLAEKHLFLKSYSCFFGICTLEHEYYVKLGFNSKQRVVLGISRLEKFIIKPRDECRQRLGLPLDKKIILQVGRAVKYRGFDWMIETMDGLKHRDELLFVFISIKESQPYYQDLIQRDCIVKGYVSIDDLVDYYNAADVHWFFYSETKQYLFGGTAYVPVEALACGTPTITNSFHHISGRGIEAVSRIPKDKSEIIPMLEDLLLNPPDRDLCRKKLLEIFDWSRVLESYWKDYNELH